MGPMDQRAGTDWWRGASLYQIYPLSFADSNGDGWGDLPGITAKLDYIAGLGVDGIWISPFFTSAWNDFGYDTIDQKSVDPRCGTLADFDALLAKAHRLGLKVLIDQVYTYTSNRHPWFLASRADPDSPQADWYDWADAKADGTPPNNWVSIFGGAAWAWDIVRRQYFMTHFLPEMPHLRVQNPAVQDALLDIARFWLDRGVDGFRLDVINLCMVDPAYRDNPPSGEKGVALPAHLQAPLYDSNRPEALGFVERLRRIADAQPDRFLLGEIAGRDPMPAAKIYTSAPGRLHSAYFVLGAASAPISAAGLRAELQAWNDDTSGWPTWSFSNHDMMRGPSRCAIGAPSPEFGTMLVALLMAARGTALLYQGDELALPDGDLPYEQLRDPASRRFYPGHLQRDGARTPMPWDGRLPAAGFTGTAPWLPVGKDHHAYGVAGQEGGTDSPLAWTRRLTALRQDNICLRLGAMGFLESHEAILAFVRRYESETILCLFNVSAGPAAFPAAGILPSGLILARGAEIKDGGCVTLAPFGFAFIRADGDPR